MLEREADGIHLWQNASESNIRPGAVDSIAAPPRNRVRMLSAIVRLFHQALALLARDRFFLQHDRAGATRHHPSRHADEIVVTRERGLGLQMDFGDPCCQRGRRRGEAPASSPRTGHIGRTAVKFRLGRRHLLTEDARLR